MKSKPATAFVLMFCSSLACAQQQPLLRELDSKQPVLLSQQDLQKLLPGASMSRVTSAGSTHFWSNDAGGKFIVSTDNRNKPGRAVPGSAHGTWRIDDKGRYCVVMDWIVKENWCRFVIQSSDGYYLAKTGKDKNERVAKVEISRK